MLVDTIVKKLEENGRVCTVGTGTDFAEAEVCTVPFNLDCILIVRGS